MNEPMQEFLVLASKRQALLERLISPAKAAAAQMEDQGMKRGAEALNLILFELDVSSEEVSELIKKRGEELTEQLTRSFLR